MGGNPWRKWLGESDDPGRNRLQAAGSTCRLQIC